MVLAPFAPAADNDPAVDMATGKFRPAFIDMTDEANGFTFKRRYDSQCGGPAILGEGWDTLYDTSSNYFPRVYVHEGQCGPYVDFELSPESIPTVDALDLPYDKIFHVLWDEPGKLGAGKLVYVNSIPRRDSLPLVLTYANGTLQGGDPVWEFDNHGYLIRYGRQRISWDEDHDLKRVEVGSDASLDFVRPDERTIVAVYSREPKKPIEYRYDEAGQLRSVKNQWGNTYRFDYDGHERLNDVVFPDKTNATALYDDSDRVIFYKDRNNCTEQYFYKWYLERLYTSGEVVKICPDSAEPVNHSDFIIRYREVDAGMFKGRTSVTGFIDQGKKGYEYYALFFDDHGNMINEVRTTGARIAAPPGGTGWYLLPAEPVFTGGEELHLYEWHNQWGGEIEVLTKGGAEAKAKAPFFARYREKAAKGELPGRIGGFTRLAGRYVVTDEETLAKEDGEGIGVEKGKVTAIRRAGVLYELRTNDAGFLTLSSGRGLPQKRLADHRRELPPGEYDAMLKALDLGGKILRAWGGIARRERRLAT